MITRKNTMHRDAIGKHTPHQKTVITPKRRDIHCFFLPPSSACAPLMMSHLIIAFACVLPLWLIAGPRETRKSEQTSHLPRLSRCSLITVFQRRCRFEKWRRVRGRLCQFLLGSRHLLSNMCWMVRKLCVQRLCLGLPLVISLFTVVKCCCEGRAVR